MKQVKNNIPDIRCLGDLYALKDGSQASSRVVVIKQLFYNETSGFGSYLCAMETTEEKVNISGVFLDKPEPLRTYWVRGERSTYQNRAQIKAHQFELTFPKTKLSNLFFFMSIPGMKRHAVKFVDAYGKKSVEAMMLKSSDELVDLESFRIYETHEPGFISVLKAEQESLKSMFAKSVMLSRLTGLNLSKTAARKIYSLFADASYEVLSENPYILLEHHDELGYDLSFCDTIAMQFGLKPNNKKRFRYGVIHAIIMASQMGHVYMPKEEFLVLLKKELTVNVPNEKLYALSVGNRSDFTYEYFNEEFVVKYSELKQLLDDRANFANDAHTRAITLYSPSDEEVIQAMKDAIRGNLVVEKNGRIYSRSLYEKEVVLARKIQEIMNHSSARSSFRQHPLNIERATDKFELEQQQKKACLEFLSEPGGLYVLTGPAGSGKTYVIKTLITAYMKLFKKPLSSVILMAPTGRAAKRIEESTGYAASTIHRALGMDEGKQWKINADNPLSQTLVLVDEFSMVDTEIGYRLFDAIKLGAKVILVGDIKQLSPVGPGNVLRDMIQSQKVPVVELDVIKRQQDQSDIIENSVRIVRKEPMYEGGKNKDAYILYRSYNDKVQQTLITSIRKIQENRGLNLEQIQILIAQRKSRIGTNYINHIVQGEFNCEEDSDVIANHFSVYDSTKRKYQDVVTYFRVGDKVINIKNNYQACWYDKNAYGEYIQDKTATIITNGEIGIVEDIVKPKRAYGEKFTRRIIVRIDNKYIFFDDDFDNLELAYAITVHKAQGSQWDACIFMVAGSHKKMLTNNLMYTAVTRPSGFLVVIGDERTINEGIANDIIEKRNTTLIEYLHESTC